MAEKKKAATTETKPVKAAAPAEKKTVKKAAAEKKAAPAEKKAPATVKKAAEIAKKAAPAKKAAKLGIVIQSPMGGAITPEEIAKKVPKNTANVYVRIDENKLYYVLKDGETGSVEIW